MQVIQTQDNASLLGELVGTILGRKLQNDQNADNLDTLSQMQKLKSEQNTTNDYFNKIALGKRLYEQDPTGNYNLAHSFAEEGRAGINQAGGYNFNQDTSMEEILKAKQAMNDIYSQKNSDLINKKRSKGFLGGLFG